MASKENSVGGGLGSSTGVTGPSVTPSATARTGIAETKISSGAESISPTPASESERTTLEKELEATREWVKSGKDQAVDQAKSVMRDLADTQKQQAVDGIKGLSGALHKAAETLQGEQQEMIARYAHLAADELGRITDVLHEKDWEDLVGETQSLARRQPALFVAGAMVTGFLMARFLKSSGGEVTKRPRTLQNQYGTANSDPVLGSTASLGMRGEAV
jgi:hypothetical protein